MKFEEILKEYNIPIAPMSHHHARVGWINFDCPFCGRDSHKYHMGYSVTDKFVTCWRCGSHRLIDTIIELTNFSYKEAKKLLGSLEIETPEKKIKKQSKLVIPKGVEKLKLVHKEYLLDRGFNWKEIEHLWKIFGISVAPRLAWRIFIPIYYHGEIVSWTTRSISKNPKITRYISASENEELIHHKHLLYGEDFARHAIIVVEGVFDVWRIGPGAVATLGSGYSNEQLERIAKYPVRAICFDSEKEAQKRARKLVNDLSVFKGDIFNIVLDANDPGEASKKEIKQIRRQILD